MVTLKDIAREANVSPVTVSNVIHKNYKKVSAQKIEEINAIIERYNYVPNANARSLASQRSMIVGIIIPNVSSEDNVLKSPYNAEMLGVLEKEIRDNGYYLMVRCTDTIEAALPVINTWKVDGVIFMGANASDVLKVKEQVSFPTVFVDTYTEGEDYSNIGVDDTKGGYIATQYLISNGHSKICFVGPSITGRGVISRRYKGYAMAMEERGLSANIKHVFSPVTSYECGIEIGKEIAFSMTDITGIFSTADILALGIIEGLRLSGKRVPEDISIVGFDNLPEGQYAWPKLTTITQNIPQKAKLIAQTLLRKMENKEDKLYGSTVLDVELVERNSVKNINEGRFY